jgi:transposase
VLKDAAGRYFASFVVQAAAGPLPPSGTETGIDLGLTHFAVLSDGCKVANPRFLRRAERRLRTAQQALSRKAKGPSPKTFKASGPAARRQLVSGGPEPERRTQRAHQPGRSIARSAV